MSLPSELQSHKSVDGDVRRLAGHSGAIVTLRHEDTVSFVRKQAGNPSQNKRLEDQALKQDRFHRHGVACPRVLTHALKDDLFYFDMEFIAGTSVAHQCQSGVLGDRDGLVAFVRSWLQQMKDTATGELSLEAIHLKLRGIRHAASVNPVLASMLPAINYCSNRLDEYDWRGIPYSECHGDLTLENILATKRGYYLIDFDVPDLSSYFFDVAKLFQDLTGHWCIRDLALKSPGSPQYLNAQLALSRLRAEIMPVIHEMIPSFSTHLNHLVVFNFMRILPYCREEATAVYVFSRINALLGSAG